MDLLAEAEALLASMPKKTNESNTKKNENPSQKKRLDEVENEADALLEMFKNKTSPRENESNDLNINKNNAAETVEARQQLKEDKINQEKLSSSMSRIESETDLGAIDDLMAELAVEKNSNVPTAASKLKELNEDEALLSAIGKIETDESLELELENEIKKNSTQNNKNNNDNTQTLVLQLSAELRNDTAEQQQLLAEIEALKARIAKKESNVVNDDDDSDEEPPPPSSSSPAVLLAAKSSSSNVVNNNNNNNDNNNNNNNNNDKNGEENNNNNSNNDDVDESDDISYDASESFDSSEIEEDLPPLPSMPVHNDKRSLLAAAVAAKAVEKHYSSKHNRKSKDSRRHHQKEKQHKDNYRHKNKLKQKSRDEAPPPPPPEPEESYESFKHKSQTIVQKPPPPPATTQSLGQPIILSVSIPHISVSKKLKFNTNSTMKEVVNITLNALEKATLLPKGQDRSEFYVAMFENALESEQLPMKSTVIGNKLSMQRGTVYLLKTAKSGIFIDV